MDRLFSVIFTSKSDMVSLFWFGSSNFRYNLGIGRQFSPSVIPDLPMHGHSNSKEPHYLFFCMSSHERNTMAISPACSSFSLLVARSSWPPPTSVLSVTINHQQVTPNAAAGQCYCIGSTLFSEAK